MTLVHAIERDGTAVLRVWARAKSEAAAGR
jgi:hypothetical protein